MDKWKELKDWAKLWKKRYLSSMLIYEANKDYGTANRSNAMKTILDDVLDKMQKLEEEEKDGDRKQ